MSYQGTGVNTTLDALLQQLANQHVATNNKLDALLTALGAPPPTQSVTLQDVVTALSTLNTNISTLRTEIAAQQTTLLGSVSSLNAQITSFRQEQTAWRNFQQGQLGNILAAVGSSIDEQTRTTNAIYATACPCEGETQLPPALSTTPLPSESEQEHCRRVQWMIAEFFDEWMARIRDVTSAINATGTALALGALAATGIGAIPAALVGGAAAAVNAAWFAGIGGVVSDANGARRAQLRQALYNATTASAAATAWASTIDSMSDVNVAYRNAWKNLIWSSWFNDLYDQTKIPSNSGGAWNTAGYSGTVCAPPPSGPTPGNGWIYYTGGTVTLSAGQFTDIPIPTSLNYKDLGAWGFTPNSDGDTNISAPVYSVNAPDTNRTLPGTDPLIAWLNVTPVSNAVVRIRNRHGFLSSTTQYRIYYRV